MLRPDYQGLDEGDQRLDGCSDLLVTEVGRRGSKIGRTLEPDYWRLGSKVGRTLRPDYQRLDERVIGLDTSRGKSDAFTKLDKVGRRDMYKGWTLKHFPNCIFELKTASNMLDSFKKSRLRRVI